MLTIKLESRLREEIIDISANVRAAIAGQNWQNGALLLFCPHTTCGLTINEGADPDVRRDLIRFFREIAPQAHGWAHIEGNSDAHIRASLLGASLLAPLEGGELKLGRWQSLYLYEGDGPRMRTLWLQFLEACPPAI